MKSNALVSCAVAAAIAAAAGAAHATSITSYASNQTAGLNVNVYISGSTAITNTLNNTIATEASTLQICAAGTVTEYVASHTVIGPSGTIGGASEDLWYCQAGAKSGVSTNLFLAIFKENTAGSINGAQPLIAVAKGGSSALTFLNPTGADVQAGTCSGTTATGGTDTGCTAGDFSNNVVPTGGVADVEANLLRTIPNSGKLSASDISTYLSGNPGVDIVWGLGLSKNAYYALQSAEGLTSTCPGGNLDSPACAPSLSRPQVASLLSGQIVNWEQLGMTNPSGDSNVYVCRRDVGSGTEASFEAYFLGARCSTSSESMQSQAQGFVVEQASTGAILNCLEGFDLGNVEITPYNQDTSPLGTYTPFTPAGHQWAIGILSTELTSTQIDAADTTSDPQTPGTGTVRMVAIDGILPTLQNVVNGYDGIWGTDAFYTIKSGDDVPSGNPLKVFQAIQSNVGHPTPTHDADATYQNVWGNGGDLSPASLFLAANPYSSFPVSGTTVETTPVNQFTKAQSGSVNNCDVPVLYSTVATSKSATESTLIGSGNVNHP